MRPIRSLIVFIILALMLSSAVSPCAFAEPMPYYIEVDLTNNIVTVYSNKDDSVVRQMICSGGTGVYESPTGTYFMPQKYKEMERTEWYKFEDGYGKYGSRIWDNYLFHSYLFDEPDENTLREDTYAAMGTPASHGCIRLYIGDAKWIAENCMPGTRVDLYYTGKRFDYEKEILYGGTYTVESGISYERYMSMAENDGELGYGSTGEAVKALQVRLSEMGLYEGKADGIYDAAMVRTVKAVQQLTGLEITGVADAAAIAMIESEACPSGLIRTLSEGMTGDAVSTLQEMLTALCLYTGPVNGTFDAATKEAVMSFQRMNGKSADGVSSPALHLEMQSEINDLINRFAGSGVRLVYDEQLRTVATINSSLRLNVRTEDGTIIGSVEPGTVVDVVETGTERTAIVYGNTTGTVSSTYLAIREETVSVPRYEAASDPSAAISLPELSDMPGMHRASYGTVSINSKLRVRTEPDLESDILFLLNPGNICRILSISDDGWAHVRYGQKYGYAMAEYFDIENNVELTGGYVGSDD